MPPSSSTVVPVALCPSRRGTLLLLPPVGRAPSGAPPSCPAGPCESRTQQPQSRRSRPPFSGPAALWHFQVPWRQCPRWACLTSGVLPAGLAAPSPAPADDDTAAPPAAQPRSKRDRDWPISIQYFAGDLHPRKLQDLVLVDGHEDIVGPFDVRFRIKRGERLPPRPPVYATCATARTAPCTAPCTPLAALELVET